MFTGIIEGVGEVIAIEDRNTNRFITIKSAFSSDLKIDQSLAHNGVCLTVVAVENDCHTVTVIQESLNKSNFGLLKVGDFVNLERAMKLGDRLDGHMVQGHVDQTATCISVKDEDGSWLYTFAYDPKQGNITVEKGSITVNSKPDIRTEFILTF